MLTHALLLAAVLVALAWFVRNDGAEYAAFKALTRTEDRQRVLRGWTIRSFLLFWGASLLVLALLGRLDALLRPPAAFAPLTIHMHRDFGPAFVPILIGAAVGGGIAGGVLATLRTRRDKTPQPKMLGDIEPMLPRNRDERRWTALLGANAGIGEELCFRLMLPLLLTLVTGNAWIAFGLSAIIFGFVHFYQGWVGIAATTGAGLFFTALYLATGSIWLAVLVHAIVNLNTLWLRPLLHARRSKS